MEYTIETAKREDLDGIHKIIYDRCLWFLKNELKGWNIEYYPKKYNKKYFLEQMKINKLFVIKLDNKVCAVMLLKDTDKEYWKDSEPAYYIHHLATDINLKGLGEKLIKYAKKQCELNNKKYLRLDCFKESLFLNSYYQHQGFKNVGSGTKEEYNYNLWEMKI